MPPATEPDLSGRPLHATAVRAMSADPRDLYRAWTQEWDRWFAAPETVWMRAELGAPFFFLVDFEGQQHPHYGRFLRLEPDRLVEHTWITAATHGLETVVTVELEPLGSGTWLTLTHTGWADEDSRHAHEDAWHSVLATLDERVRP
jgi:uncharacterized protein YndB with AHSA1/START domain